MNKTIYILMTFLFLSTSVVALARQEDPQMTNQSGSVRMLEQQIKVAKSRQEKEIAELQAIHATAIEEKAEKTARQLADLIEKRQIDYNNALAALQERLNTIRQRSEQQALAADSDRKAPDFTLSTFDGKPVKLFDYRGKTVVLEWMNTECPFSMYHYKTTSTMADLATKYKDKGVVWLTINSTSHTSPQANLSFARQNKIQSPILDDRPGKVGRAYGAKTTPHIFIINARGNIVYDGAIDNAPMGKVEGGGEYINYVDKALSEINSGKAISISKTKSYGCSVKYARR
jgi:peroxiredoxin